MDRQKILVVDDDEAVLEYLRVKIGPRYEVITTTTPREVMDLARENEPNLIVCDLDMPQMSGAELCRRLKRPTYTTPTEDARTTTAGTTEGARLTVTYIATTASRLGTPISPIGGAR